MEEPILRPVVAVRCVVPGPDGRVLLLKRREGGAGGGFWCLPGGKVDYLEPAGKAAQKELFEETSLWCENPVFVTYQDSMPTEPGGMHCVNLVFVCRAAGTVRLNDESSEYAWAGPEEPESFPLVFGAREALASAGFPVRPVAVSVLPSFSAWLGENPDQVDALVFDVDGVLIAGGRALPGAQELLPRLREKFLPFVLCTNDASHSTEEKAELLGKAGIRVDPDEIVSAGDALLGFVEGKKLKGALFFQMGDLGRPCFAVKAGLRVTRDTGALEEAAGVVVGEGGFEWRPVMEAVVNAFRARPDMLLVCPNPDAFYPAGEGRVRTAAGGMARQVSRMLGDLGGPPPDTHYLGKPHAPVFRLCHARLEKALGRPLARGRMLMAGDSLESDIAGGLAFGCKAALLLTGLTRREDPGRSLTVPDLVFERI
jgi:HAD superfamily hydrolase (TIGR01450 family)